MLPRLPTRNHTTPASSPTASTSGSAGSGAHASAVSRPAAPSLRAGTTTVCSSHTMSGAPGSVRRTYTWRSAVRAAAKSPGTFACAAHTRPRMYRHAN